MPIGNRPTALAMKRRAATTRHRIRIWWTTSAAPWASSIRTTRSSRARRRSPSGIVIAGSSIQPPQTIGMKGKNKDLPVVQPKSRAAWRAWLQKNHASSSGIWLVFAKKHSGIPSLSYADAVEEALCFGWIDSLLNPIDDTLYKQMFTPRKAKSVWSALNKQRVDKLIAAGAMTAAGMAIITLAKKTGRWESLS